MTIYVVLNSRLGFKEKIVFIVYGDYKNSVHTVEVENIAFKKKNGLEGRGLIQVH